MYSVLTSAFRVNFCDFSTRIPQSWALVIGAWSSSWLLRSLCEMSCIVRDCIGLIRCDMSLKFGTSLSLCTALRLNFQLWTVGEVQIIIYIGTSRIATTYEITISLSERTIELVVWCPARYSVAYGTGMNSNIRSS